MWAGTNITSIRMVNPDDPYVQEITAMWAAAVDNNATESSGDSPFPESSGEEQENEVDFQEVISLLYQKVLALRMQT